MKIEIKEPRPGWTPVTVEFKLETRTDAVFMWAAALNSKNLDLADMTDEDLHIRADLFEYTMKEILKK